ncbi:MAG: hypothetical protein KGI09_09040, partial [Thaumarchaeota archaeon]|nr:hypothetical protein [Nitrososphaerota archaeon]
QCTRCNKKFLEEEYDSHRCMPAIKKIKTIKYAHSYTYVDTVGRKVTVIRALDGIDFEFIEVPENKEQTKIPYQPQVNTNNTTDKETEPVLRNCYLVG